MSNKRTGSGMPIYPARTRRERLVAELRPGEKRWVAGRLMEKEGGIFCLKDVSGLLVLGRTPFPPSNPDRPAGPAPKSGDILEARGMISEDGTFAVEEWLLLVPCLGKPEEGSPNHRLFLAPPELFEKRRRFRKEVRAFFRDRGFLEVETPILVPAPGQEPHLDPFKTRLDDGRLGRDLYLITSPEYAHKRLLAAGLERIFEMARVFRNGPSEMGGLHSVEFTMLEWYRAYASYLEIMEDVESLVETLAGDFPPPPEGKDYFRPPFERITMKEAFARHAGIDLSPFLRGDPSFAQMEAEEGRYGMDPDDDPGTRFFRIFLEAVEPKLGWEKPLLVTDFPASQAALAKRSFADPKVCERFELYLRGVELANGFTELNDPFEQAERFQEEQKERLSRGGVPVPVDRSFLEALQYGMPPSGGVALGLDRLLMVLHGGKSLEEINPF